MSTTTTDGLALDEAENCLAVLNEAIGTRTLDAPRRVVANADARSPDEGLALLSAYVSIDDRRVRQAILDTVLAITSVEDQVDA